MIKKTFFFIVVVLTSNLISYGQMRELKDTLRGSVVVGERSGTREAGTRIVKVRDFKNMVAATGEADVIKYIQTLPGEKARPLFMSGEAIWGATS